MPTYTKLAFSASTNGQPILVAATASSGTLIHTATSSTTTFDEIWIWAMNTSASALNLTLQWGGVASPLNDMKLSVPASSGLYLIVPGLVLNNTLAVRAYAGNGTSITLSGFVNRIS